MKVQVKCTLLLKGQSQKITWILLKMFDRPRPGSWFLNLSQAIHIAMNLVEAIPGAEGPAPFPPTKQWTRDKGIAQPQLGTVRLQLNS
jgi:hypothetical protein